MDKIITNIEDAIQKGKEKAWNNQRIELEGGVKQAVLDLCEHMGGPRSFELPASGNIKIKVSVVPI